MFNIDFQSRTPIYEQIINQVERYIITGILKENEQLPSVRQIAFELGINPNTIQRAYSELERKGVIVSVAGKGSFVTSNTKPVTDKKVEDIITKIKKDITILEELGLNKNEIKEQIFKD
jgi:GntR family transcriptional regulator